MPVKNYVSRNGQVEYEYDDLGDILTYGRDALGNVVAGYDSATNAVFTADYKPYGEFAATTGNVAGRRFMWVGSWGYRFTSGVPVSHYVRARHLSMRMGMWTSVDPLWPSEAAFGYVGGMPTAFVDPLGLQGNQPPRRIGPPRTMRDRPRPVNRPPRRNHGRGRPEPVLPVPQPKPSPYPLGGKKCSVTTCRYWEMWLPFPNHVEYCFQTQDPGKGCSSDVHFNRYTGSTNLNCSDWLNTMLSRGLQCFSQEIECPVAEKACDCVDKYNKGGRPNYWISGWCFADWNVVLSCACDKLNSMTPAPAVWELNWWLGGWPYDNGCKGSHYWKFGPVVNHKRTN